MPANVNLPSFAYEQRSIASFEKGLSPDIQLEFREEDPPDSFSVAMSRAKTHATNLKALRTAHNPGASSTTSAVATAPASPQMSHETRRLQTELRALNSSLQRSPRASVPTSAPPSYASAIQAYATPALAKRAQPSTGPPMPKKQRPHQQRTNPSSRSAQSGSQQSQQPSGNVPPVASSQSGSRVPRNACKSPICRAPSRAH